MIIMARWQSLQIPGHKTRHNNPHPAPHCHCFTTLTNTVRPRGCRGRVSKSRIWGWIWDVYQADLVTLPSPELTGAVVTRTSAKCCWVPPDWAKVVKVVVLSQTLWLSVDWVVECWCAVWCQHAGGALTGVASERTKECLVYPAPSTHRPHSTGAHYCPHHALPLMLTFTSPLPCHCGHIHFKMMSIRTFQGEHHLLFFTDARPNKY